MVCSGKAKYFFQKLDHAAIYLLIAGYLHALHACLSARTLGLVGIRGRLGPGDLRPHPGCPPQKKKPGPVRLPLRTDGLAGRRRDHDRSCRPFPLSGLIWLVSGGLFYTVGVLFYALDKRLTTAMSFSTFSCLPAAFVIMSPSCSTWPKLFSERPSRHVLSFTATS